MGFMSTQQLLLVYDEQCPACSHYTKLLQVKATVGELVLINARDPHPVLEEITEAGLDIDQGMVLKMDDTLYYGADAIHVLSLIGTSSGLFNRLNHWAFRSKTRARFIYPILKSGRNLLLRMLGRRKINNLNIENNQRF